MFYKDFKKVFDKFAYSRHPRANHLRDKIFVSVKKCPVVKFLFFISGVPYPIVLGLIVAIPNFIPQGGGLVSALLVFVITMVTGSDTLRSTGSSLPLLK